MVSHLGGVGQANTRGCGRSVVTKTLAEDRKIAFHILLAFDLLLKDGYANTVY